MSNKKAVELSLNFIVILIISIALFGFGIIFIRNLFSQATELRDLTLEDLDNRIAELICEGSDRVCIGIDVKTIRRKEFDVFGIKILNVIEPTGVEEGQEFTITVSTPEGYFGYTKEEQPITDTHLEVLGYQKESPRTTFIKQNEEVKLGIGVQVPATAVSGTYIFNVEIKTNMDEDSDLELYTDSVLKLLVEVP